MAPIRNTADPASLARTLSRRIDPLLRGRLALDGASGGEPGAEPLARTRELVLAVLAFGAIYGACMASFGLMRGRGYGWLHLVAVMLKVPALFLLTLAVTFPSLYVFSALAGSEHDERRTLRLLLAATAVNAVVLASFGPVTLFFTLSTRSHAFVQLLNAAFFALAGLVALRLLWKQLLPAFPSGEEPAQRQARSRATYLVAAWLCVYSLVGAQMAWLLRPFIGAPGAEPALFRPTGSNVFEGLVEALRYL